jgi:hypothetical protein
LPKAASTLVAPEPTLDSQLAQWHKLDQHLDTQSKAFKTYCAPFRAEMDALEAWIREFLDKSGQNSAKTDAGTAYKSEITQPKIEDRTLYLDWALDQWDYGGNEMLQIGAPQVTAFKAYMERRQAEIKEFADQNGGNIPENASITPPGTSVSTFIRLNIRKS